MAKHFLVSFIRGLSQITWNGSRPHFACLEAGAQLFLRKLEHRLCLGKPCGKGCSRRKNNPQDRRDREDAVLSDRTLQLKSSGLRNASGWEGLK
jgi:hypothetical protein